MSLNLKNAPIIEAVIEFHCELPPNQDRSGWESEFSTRFAPDYPQCLPHHHQELELHMDAQSGQPPQTALRRELKGYRHSKTDGKQLVQCRTDGFFFNRLAPYSSFDSYLPEALRCWQLYCEVAQPVLVRKLGLRYINRLLLPMTEGRLSLESFFRNPPRLIPPVDGDDFTFTGFVHQHQLVSSVSKTESVIVLASQPAENAHLPVILDIVALRTDELAPTDLDSFGVALQRLRNLKNNIFESTLTPTCLRLFQ